MLECRFRNATLVTASYDNLESECGKSCCGNPSSAIERCITERCLICCRNGFTIVVMVDIIPLWLAVMESYLRLDVQRLAMMPLLQLKQSFGSQHILHPRSTDVSVEYDEYRQCSFTMTRLLE